MVTPCEQAARVVRVYTESSEGFSFVLGVFCDTPFCTRPACKKGPLKWTRERVGIRWGGGANRYCAHVMRFVWEARRYVEECGWWGQGWS